MSITQLRFVETVRAPFPQSTQGSGTAMTTVMRLNDPYVAILTQVPGQDRIYFLSKSDLSVHASIPTPAGRSNCTGLGYDPLTRNMIMCFPYRSGPGDMSPDEIVAVDTLSGTEIGAISAPTPQFSIPGGSFEPYQPQGIATNGVLIARASDIALASGPECAVELFTRRGAYLGETRFPDRRIRGITNSPWSWAYVDQGRHEIVIVGPFGTEVAVADGVGAPGTPLDQARPRGMASIAFDMQSLPTMDSEPQVWLPNGTIGQAGTIHHPDTPWSPEPWGGRHRIYIANESDQIIYGGYLTLN